MNPVGWWLTLIDALASEYGWSAEYIRRLPLAQVFCYHSAILARHDVDTGPSFAEREYISNLNL